MGSCMAYLNYLPPRIAGVNFCFFIAVSVWWWLLLLCKMLHKIDGLMNIQNYVYSVKWRNGDGGD